MDIPNLKNISFPLNLEADLLTKMLTCPDAPLNNVGRPVYHPDQAYDMAYEYIAKGIKLDLQMMLLLQDFFAEVGGSQYAFRFKAPLHHEAKNIQIAIGDGTQDVFKISALYQGQKFENIIPLEYEFSLWVDGQIVTDYILEGNNIILANIPPMGSVLTASFHYDKIVYFAPEGLVIKPLPHEGLFFAEFKLIDVR